MHPECTLDVADVEMLLACSNDDRVLVCCRAWLAAYNLACWFNFTPDVARLQAGAAWDRAAEEVADIMAIDLPTLN